MTVNRQGRHRKLRYKGDRRVPFARLGWEDARLGLPFRYDLPGASRSEVTAYENGRMRVLVAREQGMSVPAWNVENRIPPKVQSVLTKLNEDHTHFLRSGGCSWFAHGPNYWQPPA